MTLPAPRLLALAALGLAIAGAVAAGAAQRMPEDVGGMSREGALAYIAWAGMAGLFYAGAVVLTGRARGWGQGRWPRAALLIVAIAAIAMRLPPLLSPPLLSTDIYRYVWDGRVQAVGINPYVHLPADPALTALRDPGTGATAIYANINRADFAPTIYPPAAQAIFAAVGRVWPSIWGMKAAMLGFDVLAALAALGLLRAARLPPERVLIYAWNPLPVWEFAGGGHIDAAAVALSAVALLLAARRAQGWAGVALAAAVLCKLLPAALAPAVWRRWDVRLPVAGAVAVLAGYGWYSGAGWRVLGYLPGYASEEGLENGGGFFLLRLLALLGPLPAWAGAAYIVAAGAGLLGLGAVIALRAPFPEAPPARAFVIARAALWLSVAVLAALSPHYPWYYTAVIVPSVLVPAASVLWLTLAAPALYLDHGLGDVAIPAIVFLPFFALLARDMRRQALPSPLAERG